MNSTQRGPCIVVIDEDVMLVPKISPQLNALGCTLEALSNPFELTPELIAISEPHVVLINLKFAQMIEAEWSELITQLKTRVRTRVVMLCDLSVEETQAAARRIKADGGVALSEFVQSPAELIAHAAKLPALARAARDWSRTPSIGHNAILSSQGHVSNAPFNSSPSRSTDSKILAADAILNLELTELAPLAFARPVTEEPAKLVNSHLLDLIEEAINGFEDRCSLQTDFVAEFDLVSDHNFYTAGPGTLSGIFVWSVVLPKVGSIVNLTLEFPWSEKIELKAKVAWCKEGMGHNTFRRGLRGFGAVPMPTPNLQKVFERFSLLRHPMLLNGN